MEWNVRWSESDSSIPMNVICFTVYRCCFKSLMNEHHYLFWKFCLEFTSLLNKEMTNMMCLLNGNLTPNKLENCAKNICYAPKFTILISTCWKAWTQGKNVEQTDSSIFSLSLSVAFSWHIAHYGTTGNVSLPAVSATGGQQALCHLWTHRTLVCGANTKNSTAGLLIVKWI